MALVFVWPPSLPYTDRSNAVADTMPELSTCGPNGRVQRSDSGAQIGHSVGYSIALVGVRQTWGPYKHQCTPYIGADDGVAPLGPSVKNWWEN
eukprot:1184385-Prorocentrum_minimum.AAC.2